MSRRLYDEKAKQKVLETYQTLGLNETARRYQMDKKTILRWARAEGLDPHKVSAQVMDLHRMAGEAHIAKAARDRDEALERITKRSLTLAELAQVKLTERLMNEPDKVTANEMVQAITKAINDLKTLLRKDEEPRVDHSQLIAQVIGAVKEGLADVGLAPQAEALARDAVTRRLRMLQAAQE